MSLAAADLCHLPALRDRWVALAPQGSPFPESSPLRLALKSGATVVDADVELAELCARLNAARQTSLTIVFTGARA